MISDEKTLPVNQRKRPSQNPSAAPVSQASYTPPGSDIDAQLARAYEELGRVFYSYRFEEPTPELIEYFDTITRLRAMRNENSSRSHAARAQNGFGPQNGQMHSNRQMVRPLQPGPMQRAQNATCPHCHQPVAPDSAFCGSCGKRIR